MNDKEFVTECRRLECLGYVVILINNQTNTATLKKGRRTINVGAK